MASFFHYLGVVEFAPGAIGGARPDEHLDNKQAATSSASTTSTQEDVPSRSVEERIIDQLDYAQLCGDLIRRPADGTKSVAVDVSTNGVRFVAEDDQRVVERLAMHKIIQCLSYENEIGSCNVAIVVTKTDSNLICHLLQTENHDEADYLCQKVLEAFQSLETEANEKICDDRERRRQELEQKKRQRSKPQQNQNPPSAQ
ncbi:hypothetical protein M3Y97_00470300 [Aphelenchoides bicaudatus]|nr:hypothetical protein M3Y97_00470300 [Aphelenchoides bicaudatus]